MSSTHTHSLELQSSWRICHCCTFTQSPQRSTAVKNRPVHHPRALPPQQARHPTWNAHPADPSSLAVPARPACRPALPAHCPALPILLSGHDGIAHVENSRPPETAACVLEAIELPPEYNPKQAMHHSKCLMLPLQYAMYRNNIL